MKKRQKHRSDVTSQDVSRRENLINISDKISMGDIKLFGNPIVLYEQGNSTTPVRSNGTRTPGSRCKKGRG